MTMQEAHEQDERRRLGMTIAAGSTQDHLWKIMANGCMEHPGYRGYKNPDCPHCRAIWAARYILQMRGLL